MIESWSIHGRDSIIPAKSIRSSLIERNSNSINLFSLNSCIGSGEKRHLPEKIRAELEKLLIKYTSEASSFTDSFELIGEQLDTPAVHMDHVTDLVNKINKLDNRSVPIVLAHHNILPQAIPRWEIYTELINSGYLRSILTSCFRPIIYCHGHIHDDPIEQLIDYHKPSSKIIFISAPLLNEGFNILEIQFARNHIPLGCVVHKYRLTIKGQMNHDDSIRIPFIGNDRLPEFHNKHIESLLKVCNSDEERFEILRNLIEKDIGTRPNKDTLENLLVEAEWLNLVQISDRDHKSKHWKIRRVGP